MALTSMYARTMGDEAARKEQAVQENPFGSDAVAPFQQSAQAGGGDNFEYRFSDPLGEQGGGYGGSHAGRRRAKLFTGRSDALRSPARH